MYRGRKNEHLSYSKKQIVIFMWKKENDNKPLEYWEYWCNDGDLLLDTPFLDSNKNNKIEDKTINKHDVVIE